VSGSALHNLLMKRDKFQFRRGAVDGVQPLWRRWFAVACLVLVGFVSSAQAVHVHGQFMPHQEQQVSAVVADSQLPGSEASCPLCVAMHSTMPATAAVPATQMVVEKQVVPGAVVERVPETQWHYAMFSRPPPAVETLS